MFRIALKRLREEKGLSQEKFAAAIGVSQSAVGNWESGNREPNFETTKLIANYFDVSTDIVMGRVAPDDQNAPPPSTGGKWIPVLGDVAGGIPIEAVEDVLGYEEISLQMANLGEHFGLRVRGDSMEPRICDGDVVIVRQQTSAEDSDIAVILVNGDAATVKKIKHSAGGIMLIPNNPKHEPTFYSRDECDTLPVVILGKVVELRGKM